MNLSELCNGINLQKEMVEKVLAVSQSFSIETVEQQLKKLMDIETAQSAYEYLMTTLPDDAEHVKLLLCNLECARRIHEKYQEKGITDQVFFDTMKCFTRFIDECQKKTGSIAFDRGFWTYRQVSMNLFRIGELEYELTSNDGEKVISVHIPSDANFSDDMVGQSLQTAKEFMKQFFPEYAACKYICESWLLSPKLGELLNESSNIVKFQNRFEVIRVNLQEKDFIEWLFQAPIDTDYSELKEETSLQRKVKNALLKGENIGTGYGVMK